MCSRPEKVFELYDELLSLGLRETPRVFAAAIRACRYSGSEGKLRLTLGRMDAVGMSLSAETLHSLMVVLVDTERSCARRACVCTDV